jgi:transposase-like protein
MSLQMGQVCPQCGGDTGVIDTRPYLDGVRRRRECQACGYRYSTLEYSVAYIEELRGGDVTLSSSARPRSTTKSENCSG